MKKKLTAALLTLTLVCTGALSGCVTADPSAEEGEKGITVAISSDTGQWTRAGSIALTYLAYSVSALDELLTYDENGEIEYRAAESYEVNDDSTVWTFHLREDALWSDGTPVTSADFMNTITRALDPASGADMLTTCSPLRMRRQSITAKQTWILLEWRHRTEHTLIFRLRNRASISLICCGFPSIRRPARNMQIPWTADGTGIRRRACPTVLSVLAEYCAGSVFCS